MRLYGRNTIKNINKGILSLYTPTVQMALEAEKKIPGILFIFNRALVSEVTGLVYQRCRV